MKQADTHNLIANNPSKVTLTPEQDEAERRESIKELYAYAQARLNNERERFHRADDKAGKLAGMFVFVIGFVLFFGKSLISENSLPPQKWIDWILCGVEVVALMTSFGGWFLCVHAIRLREVGELPLDKDVIAFFYSNPVTNVRYSWAKRFADAYATNIKITNEKQMGIHFAATLMNIVGPELLVLCAFYVVKKSM